ncbi:MAG: glycerol kinase GlpK [Muribaculaceae bacterium]|nr:glycerol kinase GlpK [Roseburia sp.]MCM1432093.1 glycerol kinase GlpK [Muribaculaceae bacterium]MCM1492107.1 glycerol kinase GlpK [Muribaculaceae bacterium]
MESYIMALDQGTTSSRCILFDRLGNICAMAQKEVGQIYPQPGWVEQKPREIWSSQMSVMTEAMAELGVGPENIAAIGITNQRETTIVWEKATGKPVYNAIGWQCRRTAPMIDRLKEEGQDARIRERTGLVADAYFSASKIAWILGNVAGAREAAEAGELLFGTVDTWLLWNLTGGAVHRTDYTNASRTMLFDIHKLCWDKELLELFHIPESMLPEVMPSGSVFGYTDEKLMPGRTVIAGMAGDQQAALFGQCCFLPGEMKNTYGTGCFLLMHTGNRPVCSGKGLITTLAAGLTAEAEYALEGSVYVAGAAVQWLRDGMRLVESAAETEHYAAAVEDANGMYLVPAFAGMGAPYWDPYARGTVVGLTRGCRKEHFIRATLESIAYQAYDVILAMEQEAGEALRSLKVDGGASANNLLMQFQADITGTSVYRPSCIETTALGAAYLAGLTVGYWKDKEELRQNWQLESSFLPEMGEAQRRALLKGWHRAVDCARFWAGEE